MIAAKNCLKDAVMLLVDSGADVNVVNKKKKNETALALMFKYCVDLKTSCVEYLLDHGAQVSYLKSDVLLRLIVRKEMHFIQKFIKCGFGPVECAVLINTFKNPFCYSPVTVTRSYTPLWTALLIGNVKLAQYFVDNLFITNSDMFRLALSRDARQHFVKSNNLKCVEFLEKLSAQPMSLFSLAFVAVQSAVGKSPGREDRVGMLPLPQVLKDKLLFKVEIVPLDTSEDDTPTTNERPYYDEISVVLAELGNVTYFEYDSDDDYDFDVSDYGQDCSGDDYYKENAQYCSDDDCHKEYAQFPSDDDYD